MAKIYRVTMLDDEIADETVLVEFKTTIDVAMQLVKDFIKAFPLASAYTSNYIKKLKLMNFVDIPIPVVSKKVRITLEKP